MERKCFTPFDPQKTLTYDTFQTALYPETVVLDKTHGLYKKYPGVVDWEDPSVKADIMQAAH